MRARPELRVIITRLYVQQVVKLVSLTSAGSSFFAPPYANERCINNRANAIAVSCCYLCGKYGEIAGEKQKLICRQPTSEVLVTEPSDVMG